MICKFPDVQRSPQRRPCSVSAQDRAEPTVCRNIISGFEDIIRVERTQSGAGRIADRSRNIFRVMQRVPNESSELRIGPGTFFGHAVCRRTEVVLG